MLKSVFTLFLSPRGRIGRKTFAFAVAAWAMFYALQMIWFNRTGNNLANFLLALALLFVNVQIIYCVYGKRLHDVGRSMWPLTGLFALVLILAMFVMLQFGGLEYFETLNQNPQIGQDPAAMAEVHKVYQDTLAQKLPQSSVILGALPALFTLWLVIAPGQAQTNQYGEPINS